MADYSTLSIQLTDDIECFVFDTIPSTNDYLSGLPNSTKTQICIASEQTSGKGQYDRSWISSKDSSVLLSIRRAFNSKTNLNGLSLVIGLALVKVLQDIGINNAKIKWPNDIFVDDKKLAGVLIENSLQGDYQFVVIGIGVNNKLTQNSQIHTPWVDLEQLLDVKQDLCDLSVKIINQVLDYCQIFAENGFEYYESEFAKHDFLFGKKLNINYQQKSTIGIANGIDSSGALIVKDGGNNIKVYSSEQISLI